MDGQPVVLADELAGSTRTEQVRSELGPQRILARGCYSIDGEEHDVIVLEHSDRRVHASQGRVHADGGKGSRVRMDQRYGGVSKASPEHDTDELKWLF